MKRKKPQNTVTLTLSVNYEQVILNFHYSSRKKWKNSEMIINCGNGHGEHNRKLTLDDSQWQS